MLAVAGPARAETDEPTTDPEASKPFVVLTRSTTTAEAVIPQIVEAGREQLAAACVANPGASVRIINPLASGDYADVPCSTILDGGESLGQTSEALTSGGERLGQTQQKGVIITTACFAAGTALFLGTRYGVCEHGGGPGVEGDRKRANCNDLGSWGSVGLGFVCGFTALFPFWSAMSGRHIRPIIIGLCFAMLVLPAMRYYRTPPEYTVMGVLRGLFPAWLILFGRLCLEEGEARARRERADQEKKTPPA